MSNYHTTVDHDRLVEFQRHSSNVDTTDPNYHGSYEYQPTGQLYQHYYQHPKFDYHNLQPYYDKYAATPTFAYNSNCNRHENLIEARPIPELSKKEDALTSTEVFFQKVEDIKWLVGKINENVTEIESLQTCALLSINGKKASKTNFALEELVDQTSKLNRQVKEDIKALELNNAKLSLNSSDRQMRKTQFEALKKKFVTAIQRYQDIESAFRKKQRQRIERQMLIVKPDATSLEIEDAINSNDVSQIFAHSLFNSGHIVNTTTQVLNEVQARHQDIKSIERTILELHQLFIDMETIVEMQQETITNIEKSTEDVVSNLEQGNKHVAIAVRNTKAARHRKLCCFIAFIILLAVAGILVWWFVFPKSHSSAL